MTKPAWIVEAESHLGFREGANNANPFGKHYNIDHEPWCALFVSFCCEASGHPLPEMQAGMSDGYAGVAIGMDWAKANGFWRPSWEAVCGDAIVYGWNGPSSSPDEMHTGFVVSSGPKGSTGHTIEGNRADQVERQTFTVGSDVVLGTIAITKILASKSKRPHKPAPQPRHPHHPANTGPGPKPRGKPVHFGPIRTRVVDHITKDLAGGRKPDADAQVELVALKKAWHNGA
jgi:hypothetical protein